MLPILHPGSYPIKSVSALYCFILVSHQVILLGLEYFINCLRFGGENKTYYFRVISIPDKIGRDLKFTRKHSEIKCSQKDCKTKAPYSIL